MYRVLIKKLQRIAIFLNRRKRRSLSQRRHLHTVLVKLRRREQLLRQQLQSTRISSTQKRALLTDADVIGRQRRKGLNKLKTIIQDLRS